MKMKNGKFTIYFYGMFGMVVYNEIKNRQKEKN